MRFSAAARRRHRGQHLGEDDLLPPSRECPICARRGDRARTQAIQANPDVFFLYCEGCSGQSASRMPSQTALDRIYRDFYVPGEDHFTIHSPSRVAARLHRYVAGRLRRERVRILEVGGGDGTLARLLGESLLADSICTNVRIAELELHDAEPVLNEHLTVEFFRESESLPGDFDLVIANACLHQIPGLRDMLASIFSRIRPGGLFYATTAYVLPLMRLLGQRLDPLYPLHVHDLGCDFWNSIVETLGLSARIIRSGPSPVEKGIATAPLGALTAHLLKLPASLELALRRPGSSPRWRAVGGWEILLRLDGPPNESRKADAA